MEAIRDEAGKEATLVKIDDAVETVNSKKSSESSWTTWCEVLEVWNQIRLIKANKDKQTDKDKVADVDDNALKVVNQKLETLGAPSTS